MTLARARGRCRPGIRSAALLGGWLACAGVAAAQRAPGPEGRGEEAGEVPPAEVVLEWQAPPHCPDDAAIRARIAALLTGPPRGEGTVTVTGRIEAREGGLRLTLTTDFRGRQERRELEAPSCDELGEATAILLAIALEPELEATLGEPSTELDAVPEPTDVPEPGVIEPAAIDPTELPALDPSELTEPTDITQPAPSELTEPSSPQDGLALGSSSDAPAADARPPLPPPRLAMRLGAGIEAGALPGLSGGPHLALGLHWARLRLELHGAYLAPRRDRIADGAALFQAGLAGLRACGRPHLGRLELPLCGGIEAGAVRGSTRGFEPPRTRNGPWLGPLVSAGLARRWDRLGLWSALEAVAPLYRGEFVFAGEVGFSSFPVSGRLLLGLELLGG